MSQVQGKGRPAWKNALVRCQRGATAIEYGLILAMIALTVIGAMSRVADKTINMWTNVANEVVNH